jgi:hypothetical protein
MISKEVSGGDRARVTPLRRKEGVPSRFGIAAHARLDAADEEGLGRERGLRRRAIDQGERLSIDRPSLARRASNLCQSFRNLDRRMSRPESCGGFRMNPRKRDCGRISDHLRGQEQRDQDDDETADEHRAYPPIALRRRTPPARPRKALLLQLAGSSGSRSL